MYAEGSSYMLQELFLKLNLNFVVGILNLWVNSRSDFFATNFVKSEKINLFVRLLGRICLQNDFISIQYCKTHFSYKYFPTTLLILTRKYDIGPDMALENHISGGDFSSLLRKSRGWNWYFVKTYCVYVMWIYWNLSLPESMAQIKICFFGIFSWIPICKKKLVQMFQCTRNARVMYLFLGNLGRYQS